MQNLPKILYWLQDLQTDNHNYSAIRQKSLVKEICYV